MNKIREVTNIVLLTGVPGCGSQGVCMSTSVTFALVVPLLYHCCTIVVLYSEEVLSG